MVSILLNMAYIPEEVIGQFAFESGFHKKFKPSMDEFLQKFGKSRSGKSSKDQSSILSGSSNS